MVIARDSLRYTPAGLAAVEFELEHRSTQIEADAARLVQLNLQAISFGAVALQVMALPLGAASAGTGQAVQAFQFEGFLAPARKGARLSVFHVTAVHGAQATG
jgi:primosomal replication protein N